MQLDHDQLHKLLDALGESDIQEFRLEGDDFRLEVRRNLPVTAVAAPVVPVAQVPAPVPVVDVPAQGESASAAPPAAAGSRSDLVDVTAPMVGTFYTAPAPGEAPFVEIGNRINAGQTICILEAMKLMNELEAEVAGEVVEILVDNGTPVEFGQVLMRVKPG
ncbi:acetyl-CoA carboxylase/ biotin carboxyl carrier protein [Synechococcus sp. MIT S9220]|uniref:acetyl-CoA carboxylase biotin carboxyl carrier protein n=1 Tax=unclassified Synechococcus TaxID=2626047 RepID=UPI00164BDAF5|nr:acetyl-CoA carboxylase biotin carboxyl carrier protein [Synechococcus sp. MIT S9220]NOL48179.1 acetyl-CoA carboxylase biotin carboxyl carrier protein [Synechococcus sp. MIT S9220]QNJ21371.1 acetyl-CoA carboxylase/ biotin carboxyl carrier protein [Synechococcus sp. MIT S9220]